MPAYAPATTVGAVTTVAQAPTGAIVVDSLHTGAGGFYRVRGDIRRLV